MAKENKKMWGTQRRKCRSRRRKKLEREQEKNWHRDTRCEKRTARGEKKGKKHRMGK